MAPPTSFDHCVIHITDWDRSNSFYREVVGAQVVEVGPNYAYRFGNAQLNIHGPGVEAEPLAHVPVAPGNSDLCFTWEGPIEAAVQHLGRNGVEIELGPVERMGVRGKGTSVYFRDPDGSLLEFISY
jgi:catechol 2,3-dioxygenase-like lactoylglutathione lyase family enzyme